MGRLGVVRRLLSVFCGKRRRRQRGVSFLESLEVRQLLAVADLQITVDDSADGTAATVVLAWQDSENSAESSYEIWLQQDFTATTHNSKVYYRREFDAAGTTLTHAIPQDLAPGDYTVFLLRHDGNSLSNWVQQSFQVDDDADAATAIVVNLPPRRPEITVVREGQGAAGQAISEGAVQWVGDASLYDVWLGQRNSTGGMAAHSVIRNVPNSSITLRELALASERTGVTYYGDVAGNRTLAQLNTGDYEIYVRGVNGALDSAGNWIGRGPWSRGAGFSFVRLEGSAAVPDNLRVTHELRPTIKWDPVAHAEAYLVSFWKGPDYQNHSPLNIRVNGTEFSPTSPQLLDGHRNVALEPGDDVYVRVRAISSEGTLEGFRPGNFAHAVITIPSVLSAADLKPPVIKGPGQLIGDSMPVLEWQHSPQAATYEIWFSSLQTRRRMFLATGITDNVLHLNPEVFTTYARVSSIHSVYSAEHGLADGRYRFWIRAENPAAPQRGAWSQPYYFTVESSRVTKFDLYPDNEPASLPLVSPNLIESYVENDKEYLLITNGLGESFGASVVARFLVNEEGVPIRPVVRNQVTGTAELQFPDLAMGSNVADMAFLDERRLVVLSRGSNDIRIVDVVDWEIVSEFALSPGAGDESPDAMDLEILSNGQILVVFNRSDRLRVIDVDENGQLVELPLSGTTLSNQGFVLEQGRAMHVSAA